MVRGPAGAVGSDRTDVLTISTHTAAVTIAPENGKDPEAILGHAAARDVPNKSAPATTEGNRRGSA